MNKTLQATKVTISLTSVLLFAVNIAESNDLQIDVVGKQVANEYRQINKKVIKPYISLQQTLYDMIFTSGENLQYYIFGAAIKNGFSFRGVFDGCYRDFLDQENKNTTDVRYGVYPTFRPLHYGFNRERKFHPQFCGNENYLGVCHDSRVEFKPIMTPDSSSIEIPLPAYEKLTDGIECFYGDARKFGFDDNDLSFDFSGAIYPFPTVICAFQYDWSENYGKYSFYIFESDVIRFMSSSYMSSLVCKKADQIHIIPFEHCLRFYRISVEGLERMR